MLASAVGDALGAPNEFAPVIYNDLTRVTEMIKGGKFNLQPGQRTDDTAQMLCLADSLLVHHHANDSTEELFDPLDFMVRLVLWYCHGYNNGLSGYQGEDGRCSFGLGGNTNSAMLQFLLDGSPITTAGTVNTSGNGSIMRLAPVAVMFWRDAGEAMDVAKQQSFATHQGVEAAECARLLTFVCSQAIAGKWTVDATQGGGSETIVQRFLREVCGRFATTCLSVLALAKGQQETTDAGQGRRKWTWRDPDFQYSPVRDGEDDTYRGSYAMEGMVMALHCVYTTTTLADALLKAVNIGGDADSVGSICGQIAGAVYGLGAIPRAWIKAIQVWDNGGDIALTASLLYNAREVGTLP